MLSITKARETLGSAGKKMTDKEVEELSYEASRWADLVFDCWLDKIKLESARKRLIDKLKTILDKKSVGLFIY